ncbi:MULTISPECIES: GNAT family protein [unclassified Stenotrophomonas]|uniref:GNAT family N-acetyltransferase n=1 Tax=unclassified Stenotrophomonas TaxID=196198 RepID=UPI000D16E1F7|nr:MULTISPECIES: GNAT family protein [unclassified Stenotrophomonas]PTA73055.1 GNAT family N-acetyltransferase [Stenotrophomonas sp. Nf1]PTA76814.1 GNAT family N-acetyltransferase [Stenotrophomonas sp. Nf4]
MNNSAQPSCLPPLHPVRRRHLLHLQAAPVTLRSFLRTDLPRWRIFDDSRRRGHAHVPGVDEEARFLAGMHRSSLEYDHDQLQLGVFDDVHGTLLDQVHVRLQSAYARCAEIQSLQHRHAYPQAALQALCTFLFENVGLHRIYVLLPPSCTSPFADALRATGFECEGVLRDQHLDAAGWQDRQLLALTAPGWRNRQQAIR